MLKERLTRREAINLFARITTYWALARRFNHIVHESKDIGTELPQVHIPESLSGVGFNYPFPLLDSKEQVQANIEWLRENKVTVLRVFGDKLVDHTSLQLNTQKIKEFDKFLHVLESSNHPFKVILSLFDCYRLLHSRKRNIYYSPEKLYYPPYVYGNNSLKNQLNFFADEEIISNFQYAIALLASYYRDNPVIGALEIANEPQIPNTNSLNKTEKESLLTHWFHDSIVAIRSVNSSIPIFTGLADHRLINDRALSLLLKHTLGSAEAIINTSHIYWPPKTRIKNQLANNDSIFPVAVTEIGASSVLLVPDTILKGLIGEISGHNITSNNLYTQLIMPWQIGSHNDSFTYNPPKFPETQKLLEEFRQQTISAYRTEEDN